MDYVLIKTNADLAEVCARARRHQAVALDTEFVRTRTLAPHIGLIQLYDGHQLVLIDPLAISDFRPFIHLLEDTDVIKVLHSCSEDLETFLVAYNTAPQPVFDTQFAANVLGMGATLGYARLIEMMQEVVLDKGESRTDWLKRPLSEKQLHYAANDVLYLLPAFKDLYKMVQARGKLSWIYDEIAMLVEKKRTILSPDQAYLQIKNVWRLHGENLFVLQALAGWRLTMARKKDLALNFVVKESALFEAARTLPRGRGELGALEGMAPQAVRMYGDTLLGLIEQARADFKTLPERDKLPRIQRLIDIPAYKKTLSAIKEIGAIIAQQQGVSPDVLASKKQINQLLKWWWFKNDDTRAAGLVPDLLNGWRRPLYEAPLINLLGPIPW